MAIADLRQAMHGGLNRFWAWLAPPVPEFGDVRHAEIYLEGEDAPISVVTHTRELSNLLAHLATNTPSRIMVHGADGYTHVIVPQRVTHFKFR